LSRRATEPRVFPYLWRGLTLTGPNHVWGIDITYVRVATGWLYLVAVLDWFARDVLRWALSDSLAISFVLDTMPRALA
jgi:putative transposase